METLRFSIGTVVDSRSQISLGRALYMPDELNLHLGAGEKNELHPKSFLSNLWGAVHLLDSLMYFVSVT